MRESRSQVGCVAACAVLFLLLASPAGRAVLEARLVTHMLVQMPLLVLIGVGIGWVSVPDSASRLWEWNQSGATGLLIAVAVAMFWMLPRAMDAALVDMRFEAGKFVSLPLAGVALSWSYPKAGAIAKGVLNAHVVSALGVMGWAYLASPQRLCNGYLVADQEAAGIGLLAAGAVFSLYFAVRIIFGPARPGRMPGACEAELCERAE